MSWFSSPHLPSAFCLLPFEVPHAEVLTEVSIRELAVDDTEKIEMVGTYAIL
jgi:hypothetical protein